MEKFNFLIVGVGGQGALLASNIIANVGIQVGYDVKKAEVHGMSQRGGSVNSHIRWGSEVYSPVIGEGDVDIMLALEKLETLRYLKMLRPSGLILVGDYALPPLGVSSGQELYPNDSEIQQFAEKMSFNIKMIPTLLLAAQAGSVKAHNVVLLGSLSKILNHIPINIWYKVIEDHVPQKYLELNITSFTLGRDFIS